MDLKNKRIICVCAILITIIIVFGITKHFISIHQENTQHLIETLKFTDKVTTVSYGDSLKLKLEVIPKSASDEEILWTSSDTSLVSVDSNGNITVLRNVDGKVIVTASTRDGSKKTSIEIKVKKIINGDEDNIDISLNTNSVSLNYGQTTQLIATVTSSNTINTSVIWSSSDTSLVSVDQDGNISAIKNVDGTATITATTVDGNKSVTAQVTVKKINVKVTGIKINNSTSGTVYLNKKNTETIQLSHTITPSDASNKKVTWSSSNTSVATVDSTGKVTPNALGSVAITVKTADGNYSASYRLDVKQKVIVVITASAGKKMQDYVPEYTSKNGNYYYSNGQSKPDNSKEMGIPGNGSLLYVYKWGAGFDFQHETGTDAAISTLNAKVGNKKDYVELSVFYTLTGNTVKKYDCDMIVTNHDNLYTNTAQKYTDAINKIKSSGYKNIKGFIISHSPLNTVYAIGEVGRTDFAYSHKAEACQSGYRSAWKYWLSNRKMEQILKNGNYNLTFIDNYENFVTLEKVNNNVDINSIINGKATNDPVVLEPKFKWWEENSYTTEEDGLHFDGPTAKRYVQFAFDTANR